MTQVWRENGYRLMCDGASRTLFVLDGGGNILAMSGKATRRMLRFFPSLGEAGNFRLASSRIWKAVAAAGRPNHLFEDAIGIPHG